MLIRPIRLEEKELYNSVVNHPVQTWQWGEFRRSTGQKIERVGFFKDGQIQDALQVTFHSLPYFSNFTVGYCARASQPTEDQLDVLKNLGEEHNAIFIKLEPNVVKPVEQRHQLKTLIKFLLENGCQPGRPFFAENTFQIDLTQSEEKLFADLKSKTRYNTRLARRKGVTIIEDNSRQGLQTYLDILQETLERQKFYLHSPEYFQKMWDLLHESDLMHIFHAEYDNMILASWILFKWKDTVYYPYGASRDAHREIMASNLMMWEMITWAKRQGAEIFDMWGSLGPDPDKKDSWYGFHRFKKGYGGDLMQFIGTFDLVLKQPHYKLFRIADNWRWKFLNLKAKVNL